MRKRVPLTIRALFPGSKKSSKKKSIVKIIVAALPAAGLLSKCDDVPGP